MTYEGIGSISFTGTTAMYPGTVKREAAPSGSSANQFDSVIISAQRSGSTAMQRELVGRITREVRTSMTTGEIRRLQQQVAEGTYRPDPAAIAGRLLMMTEG